MACGGFTSFYGSLSPASNLLNCVIALDRNTEDARISVEADKIIIKTRTYAKTFNFSDLKLFPETCRGLKYSSGKELQFSIRAELPEGKLEPALPTQYSSQSDTVDQIKLEQNRWFCGICKHKIISDGCIFSRILPLPSENWQDYADMWFCHDHGDGDSRKGQRLLPKLRECFVGETFILVARQHLMKAAVKVVRGEDVVCGRCGRQLGSLLESEADTVKIFLHTIVIGTPEEPVEKNIARAVSENGPDQSEELFARLLLEQSQLYTSYRFIVETRLPVETTSPSSTSTSPSDSTSSTPTSPASGGTSTCLVWLLDGNGCMYRSESAETIHTVQNEDVVNILFKCQLASKQSKPDALSQSLISLWKRDNAVHGITLPHPVFVQLVSTLVQNCKAVPRSLRFTNGFHVSFLRRAKAAG